MYDDAQGSRAGRVVSNAALVHSSELFKTNKVICRIQLEVNRFIFYLKQTKISPESAVMRGDALQN